MINEYGENIGEEEIDEIAKKVKALSLDEIDTLWNLCGWSDAEKGRNKSLPEHKLENIKKSQEAARQYVKDLLAESHKKEVIENLNKVSKRMASQIEKDIRNTLSILLKQFLKLQPQKKEMMARVIDDYSSLMLHTYESGLTERLRALLDGFQDFHHWGDKIIKPTYKLRQIKGILDELKKP